jgi:ubiquinol-cytochrome c reductase cytochrome c1 subunit
MIKITTIFAAGLIALGLSLPVVAAEEGAHIEKQNWSFAGIFGKYDQNQLQRGFQVFREVCAACHSARLLAFRNLEQPGGPEFSEAQVKALAAEYTVTDPDAPEGTRKALPSDYWPGTGQSDADLAAAFGMVPPDLSVMAKARKVNDAFPNWVFNYFTTYSEGGVDYLHALLLDYEEEVPPGTVDSQGQPYVLPEGKFFNAVFPGHAIGMPPPLSDGQVAYANADGSEVPAEMLTADQYSRDVSAFLMWVAEPHLNDHKAAGFRVLAFLLVFAVLMWFVKQRIWRNVEH